MQKVDCKSIAQEILDKVKESPDKKKLLILRAGDNVATDSYVKGKVKDAEYCGIPCEVVSVSEPIDLLNQIWDANSDDDVAGIIVQLPLPSSFGDPEQYTGEVAPFKDVDGFLRDSFFEPCTPSGIELVMRKELGDIDGMNVLIIGRGELVGKPLAKMLTDQNCTVTLAHSHTKELSSLLTHQWDVIVCAAGKPKLVNLLRCFNSRLVIDVGTNMDEDGRLCGDCYNYDPERYGPRVTPVPGGIGLMTRAVLMEHVAAASSLLAHHAEAFEE